MPGAATDQMGIKKQNYNCNVIMKMSPHPSINLFKSEYLISLFFAASQSAALTSFLAMPCKNIGNI
jgi:hypothetical protein